MQILSYPILNWVMDVNRERFFTELYLYCIIRGVRWRIGIWLEFLVIYRSFFSDWLSDIGFFLSHYVPLKAY